TWRPSASWPRTRSGRPTSSSTASSGTGSSARSRAGGAVTRRGLGVVAGLVMAAALAAVAGAAECKPPLAATPTVVGLTFCADPRLGATITERIRKLREEVRAQRRSGKLIVYASTPISPRGGGDMAVNVAIAASVKARLEKEFGSAVWVLDPGRYQLPEVDGRSAGGGDYMVMWAEVLGGEDGAGR